VLYVETSALGRVLLDELDAPAIGTAMEAHADLVASRLLAIELRRLGARTGLVDRAERLLGGVTLRPLDEDVQALVERIEPSNVATLAALHLATAVGLAQADGLEAILTYDRRLADGARHHGLTVLSPSPQTMRPSA